MKLRPITQTFEPIRVEATCIERTLIFECEDHAAFKAMPTLLEDLDGDDRMIYTKTGWNSDRGEAYYKRRTIAHRLYNAHVCTLTTGRRSS